MSEGGNWIGLHSYRLNKTERSSWEENKFNSGNIYDNDGSW